MGLAAVLSRPAHARRHRQREQNNQARRHHRRRPHPYRVGPRPPRSHEKHKVEIDRFDSKFQIHNMKRCFENMKMYARPVEARRLKRTPSPSTTHSYARLVTEASFVAAQLQGLRRRLQHFHCCNSLPRLPKRT